MTESAKAKTKGDGKPAVAIVEIEGKTAPVCEEDLQKLRDRSAKAGKMKSLPKGMTKANAATFVGTNKDDVLPISVRALTEIEKENEPRCQAHHLGD